MKKKVLSLILCLLLVLLLTVFFAACDDKNGDDGDRLGNYVAGIDGAEFESTMNGFVGYAIDFTSDNDKRVTIMQGGIAVDNGDFVVEYLGVGNMGWFVLSNGILTEQTDEWGYQKNIIESAVYLYFYDSNEHANSAVEIIEEKPDIIDYYGEYEEGTQFNVIQRGRLVISETKQGLYDEIKGHALSQESKNDGRVKFVLDSMRKEMRSDNRSVELGEFNELIVKNGKVCNFGIYAMPKNGNREKVYKLVEKAYSDENDSGYFEQNISPFVNEINSQKDEYYTKESYAQIVNSNGSAEEYAIYYLQNKEGLYYEESDNGCTLIDVYIDENSFTLPVEYNGKTINVLGSSNYNGLTYALFDVLTDVYYEGTMEQWASIHISPYDKDDWKKVNIHCSDGIIEKTAGNID